MTRSTLSFLLAVGALLMGGSTALAATQATPVAQTTGSADFGNPPSGKFRFFITIATSTASPTCSSKVASSRPTRAAARSSYRCARCSSRWARRWLTIHPAAPRR